MWINREKYNQMTDSIERLEDSKSKLEVELNDVKQDLERNKTEKKEAAKLKPAADLLEKAIKESFPDIYTLHGVPVIVELNYSDKTQSVLLQYDPQKFNTNISQNKWINALCINTAVYDRYRNEDYWTAGVIGKDLMKSAIDYNFYYAMIKTGSIKYINFVWGPMEKKEWLKEN